MCYLYIRACNRNESENKQIQNSKARGGAMGHLHPQAKSAKNFQTLSTKADKLISHCILYIKRKLSVKLTWIRRVCCTS
jgi:hypothetical protein